MTVKKESAIHQLEVSRDRLIQSLDLFHLVNSAPAPACLKHLNVAFAKTLLSGANLPFDMDGLCPESASFCREVSRQSEKFARPCLTSDIQILQRIADSGMDQVHDAPFAMIEGGFPVRIQGKVIHCLWSGKLRETPFSSSEIEEIAGTAKWSRDEAARKTAAIPVYSRSQIDRFMELCRRLRAGIEQSINYHIRSNELTRQLVQSERTHSLGTLSGGVAHHFNNLLSIILGYSSLVLSKGKLAIEIEDAMRKISEAAQRGRRLTEEVLAFLGSDVEDETVCPVHDMLSSTLSLLESQISGGVRIESRLAAQRDEVWAAPSSIRQILFNLLTNAADGLVAGGILHIATDNARMPSESGVEQEFFRMEVADSGAAPRVAFEKLGPRDTSSGIAGMSRASLKLSSLYGMVGRLDGTVMMATEPGGTSRVQILLPVVAPKAKALDEIKARRRLAPCHVWVVDDDAIFCAMCRQLMQDEGHTVEELSSGRDLQARWLGQERRPDLILLDFSMPEFNGLQLCEWLKNKGLTAPVILVSGFTPSQPDIRKALKLKKTAFLQKPFSARELSDAITMILGETLIGE